MTGLMSIGAFSTATWLSPKALRLYDQKGLLSPDTVDPTTGYRRYSPAQVETARLITLLRRIDMPLDQIGELLAATPTEQAERIAQFRELKADQHARRQALAQFVEHAVQTGSLNGDGQPGISKFEVSTRSVPETPVMSATRHTAARDLPRVIRELGAQLFPLAERRGGASGQLVVIYHGQVGWESDGPIEVCVSMRTGARAHRIEPAHRELFTHVLAQDVQFPRILAAFEAVQLRAAQLGLSPVGPPREVYNPAQDAASMPRCEVALPVEE